MLHLADLGPADLALAARRTLAEAATATLLVDGVGELGPADGDIVLDEVGGRPRFLCTGESAVARAADGGFRAILRVARPGWPEVLLAGVLTDADGGCTGAGTRIVELRLASVVVEHTEPDTPVVRTRQIPLERYLAAPGELDDLACADLRCAAAEAELRTAAETLRTHTNTRHADRLRALAAQRSGQDADRVAQARLTRIDARGATLEWIDADGASSLALDFPHPATDARELAVLLRCRLTGGTCG